MRVYHEPRSRGALVDPPVAQPFLVVLLYPDPPMTQTSVTRVSALQSLIDSSRILVEPSDLVPYGIGHLTPTAAAKPSSANEAAEVIRYAAAEKLAIIPCGARTKLVMGAPPSRYDIALDMTGLSQIAHYDPADLTLSVDCGMPLAALNATLYEHKQFLPLFNPYYSAGTVGGAVASGLDSPLRQFYGTPRDFLLGAEFIDGSGSCVKSGGRVVKNVTGYDLHKLLIGSLGTLAVITRLNFRTFPEAIVGSRGFLASFLTHEAALALRHRIAESQITPLTLDVLNPTAAGVFATRTPRLREVPAFAGEDHRTSQVSLPLPGDWFRPQEWQLCAAFAGPPEVLDRCARELTTPAEQSQASAVTILDDTTRPCVWGRLREAIPLFRESSPAAAILRLNILPAHHGKAVSVLESVADAAKLPLAVVARATGPLYVALLPETASDTSLEQLAMLTQEVFALGRSCNGSASLLFAPAALPGLLTVPAPPPPGRDLMLRLKSAFDPHNIFAPNRLLLDG
jgi:glycolate oxidase FAD binding subunit